MQASRVLVIGGAGFVGSNLVNRLLREGAEEVTVIDNLLSSQVENLPLDSRVRFIFGSASEDAQLARVVFDFDYVFNLACYHGNQSSIVNPLEDFQNSSLVALQILDRISREAIRPKKIVYSGAGCAVAEKNTLSPVPTHEAAPVSLFHDSPYSISKLVGEMYGNYFYSNHNLPVVNARFQNVYGPGEILGAGLWRGTSSTVWRNVVPTFIWKALQGDPILLHNDGKSSRDFIFVDDIVEGLIRCAIAGLPGQTYNLASGKQTTVSELASIVLSATGSQSEIKHVSGRTWDTSLSRFGSTEKSSTELGFAAAVGLEQGIEATVKWTQRHEEIIATCISKHNYFLESEFQNLQK